ncbi:outer membrane receptor for ferrienterochelin and colicins [Gilliamella bombicola]|uniref:Outer membrane receptor for ferrienterochelin and colicins n=1 Tax=Gilliamella bombicola TaxID=1798182 RepID=A0A1C3ZP12_9GAMM|nr:MULTISPECIES: TonB-dependent receptor [Gilliamella]NUF26935.1 TonB-dependent receptor [Gilliamella sp. ESL0254]SCB83972.1 outer membrane receptor for ferrienterochelin and colicins [Gilliamella bombicola]
MKAKKKFKLATHAINTGILLSLSSAAIAASNTDTDTMVVTASGFSQQVKEAPATISVITPKEIENKPYRDVTDALKDIPGVTVTGGGDSTDISIRGMDAKYTMILIDGKKVSTRETRPNSDNSGFEQGWLPPLTAIERIEVVRGPMSSLYGSDAMGGVINIITKKVSDKWHGGVRLESVIPYRSAEKNTYTGSFSTLGPLIDDILGIQLYGQYSKRNEDKFLNGHAEQKLRSINGKVSLNATDTQKFDLDFGRALQNSKSTGGKTRPLSRGDFLRDNRRNSFAVTHNGLFDDISTTSFVAYEGNNNPERKMKIRNTDVDTRATLPFSINMLTIGGKYNYQELHDKGNQLNKSITKIDRWNYALFAEDELRLLESWSLTLGLRYNKDENYGSNWNPRVYSVWNIDDNFTLKGGYSTGFATPQLRQVVSDWGQVTGGAGTGNKGMIMGNPDLKPEKSNNFEIGVGYTNDYGVDASATAFYTKYKDKIQSYYICQGPARRGLCKIDGYQERFDFVQGRENVGKADLKGLELSFKTPLFTDFLLSSNYSWTKTEQKSGQYKGRALNRTPKQKFNTQLDWYATQQWDLWAKMAYYGMESSNNRNGTKIEYPGYTFWDVGASYQVHKQAKIYAGVYNLFDKDVSNEDFGKTLEGRRYFVGTEINF